MRRIITYNNGHVLGYRQTAPGYYDPVTRPYFGTGADGDLSTTGNVTLTSTLDGERVVKHYNNLTVNVGHTLTVSNRCKGLILYVNGTLTLNGIIDMSTKGGNSIPTWSDIDKFAIRITERKAPPHDTIVIVGYEYMSQSAMAKNSLPYQMNSIYNSTAYYPGNNGAAAITSGCGGDGGNGGQALIKGTGGNADALRCLTLAGFGNLYSGGAGAGGVSAKGYSVVSSTVCFYAQSVVGFDGAGGNGSSVGDTFNTGGGAGSPGGTGTYAGGTGKGGALIIICRVLSGSGQMKSNGAAGGGASSSVAGGGGSGGGPITLLWGAVSSWTGSAVASGGAGGTSTSGCPGGAGGAGYIHSIQLT